MNETLHDDENLRVDLNAKLSLAVGIELLHVNVETSLNVILRVMRLGQECKLAGLHAFWFLQSERFPLQHCCTLSTASIYRKYIIATDTILT